MFQHYESILRRYHLIQRLLNSGQLGGTLAQFPLDDVWRWVKPDPAETVASHSLQN